MKSTALLLLLLIGMTGCVTTSPLALETQDELRTMREAKLAYTIGGALVGAAIGGGIAAATGADDDDIVKSAVGGGLLGGLGGYGLGTRKGEDKVYEKRQAKASEAYLRQEIAKARKYNGALVSYNRKLRNEIASLKRNYNAQNARYAKRQSTKLVKEVDGQIANRQRFLSDPANSAGKSRMNSTKSQLQSERNKLASMVNTLEALEATHKA